MSERRRAQATRIAVLGAVVGWLAARRHQLAHRKEAQLAALFRSAADVVAVVRDGRAVFCSAGVEQLTGRSVDRMTGVDTSAELCLTHVDGSPCWVDVTAVDLHDSLTNLANRALFSDRLDLAVKRLARRDDLVGLMVLDLDHFKPVNDEFGHAAGDEVLRETAARLTELVRANDTVARLGGDKFAVLVEDLTDRAAAMDLAERLSEALHQPIVLADGSVTVGVSIGVAFAEGKGADGETLLHNADLAMYSAKERGRGSIEQFGFHLGAEGDRTPTGSDDRPGR